MQRTGNTSRNASRQVNWWLALVIGVFVIGVGMGDLRAQQDEHEGHSHADQQSQPAAASADSVRQLELAAMADSSFDNLYRLGVAYLDRDRPSEAVRAFERCTELDPKQVKSWVNLGASLDAIGRGPEARRNYRQALELEPFDEISLCRLAASLYANNLRAAAVDTLRLTMQKHPKSYCAYFTLGVAFADSQIYQEAIRCWQKVVEFGPGTPEAESAEESITTLQQILQTP